MKYRELYLDNYYVKNIYVPSGADLDVFLLSQLSSLPTERFCIGLLSDDDEVLLWTDATLLSSIGRDAVSIPMVEISRLIAMVEPHKLFMAHNHPTGILFSSESDRVTTLRVMELCEQFGVEFVGHYLVAGEQVRIIDVGDTERDGRDVSR